MLRKCYTAQEKYMLEWRDVEFNGDDSQKKMNSSVNYSLLTKMAMGILKNNAKKLPLERKKGSGMGWQLYERITRVVYKCL